MAYQAWNPEFRGLGFLSAGWLDNGNIVYTINSDDYVSVGIQERWEKLTVAGNISAQGFIYAQNLNRLNSAFVTLTSNSGTWNDALTTNLWLRAGTATYLSTPSDKVGIGLYTGETGEKLTVVGNISAGGDIYALNTFKFTNGDNMAVGDLSHFKSAYTDVAATSANWTTTHATVCANSATWSAGGGGGGSGTVNTGADGRIAYYDGAGTAVNDAANLHWDDSNNYLGIGITSALSANLHVQDDDDILGLFQSTDAGAYIQFVDSSTAGSNIKLGAIGNDFVMYTGGQVTMRMTSGGYVGLGPSAPAEPAAALDVHGGGDDHVGRFRSSDTYSLVAFSDSGTSPWYNVWAGSYGNELVLGTNNTTRMTIDNSGNVGIGVDGTINEPLTVTGNISASQDIRSRPLEFQVMMLTEVFR